MILFFYIIFFFLNIFYPLYGQSQQKSVWGKWSADCLTWYFFFPFLFFFQHSSEVSILFRDSSRIMPTLAPPLAPPTMHWLHEVSHGHAHCPESMHHQSRHAIAGWTHGRMVTCLPPPLKGLKSMCHSSVTYQCFWQSDMWHFAQFWDRILKFVHVLIECNNFPSVNITLNCLPEVVWHVIGLDV